MYGKRVTTEGGIRPGDNPAAVLEDARRNIGRDILAGGSGVSATGQGIAHWC